jgi:hypothetical protein
MTINQTKIIDIKYQIEGFENYGFGSDKNLYNLKTGRLIKKCLKGYTRGFNLDGKFITENKLRPKVIKKELCPF